jgi:hypothetical protein
VKRKRKRISQHWQPLEDVTAKCDDDFLNGAQHQEEDAKLMRVWRSPLYEVYEYECPCIDVPGAAVTWLSIKRRDKAAIHDWRHLQWIKNQVCGPDREACELYPSERRLVDTSNQYHLWVLQEGYGFPFGYRSRAVVAAEPHEDRYVPGTARQRSFEPGTSPPDALSIPEADAAARKLMEGK